MPSVGMIRSTRVFVPKSVSNKYVDGKNRGFEKNKLVGLSSGGGGCRNNWSRFIEDSGETPDEVVVGGGDYYCKSKKNNGGFCGEVGFDQEDCLSDLNEEIVPSSSSSSMGSVNNMVDENRDKMYGIVYSRKRRRLSGERFVSCSQVEDRVSEEEDRRFGIQFVRKHPRKKSVKKPLLTELTNRARTFEVIKEDGLEWVEDDLVPQLGVLETESSTSLVCKPPSPTPTILSFVVESSWGSDCRFSFFLASVLRFMRKSWLRLPLLAGFMSSEPISRVFSMHGIRILNDPFSKITWKDNNSLSGTCNILGTRQVVQITGTRQLIPIFCVDFLAIPHSFIKLHSCIALRTQYLPICLLRYLKSLSSMFIEVGIPRTDSSVKKRKVDFGMGATGFSSFHPNVRRKRNSLRTGRVKNTLSMDFFLHSDTDFSMGSDGYNSFSVPVSKQKQRKLPSMDVSSNVRELKSTLEELKQNMDVVTCSANVLVIESVKCYRKEGAEVMLDCRTSNQCRLLIKIQGLVRYSYKAHEQMRSSTTNRFTHAMIWTGGNGWKLEFPDRRDWFIFKELHRECIDRNLRGSGPPAKAIPVPYVREVPGYENDNYVPFVKPDVYIAMPEDELERASMSEVAIYDADTGDEQWLGKLNIDHGLELVSVEKFEEMIDTFEKVAFYCPDDAFDGNKAAASLCPDLERDVVASVYQHWLRKRKKQRGPLLRVFQNRKPKKAQSQVLNRPVTRKRRTAKTQNQPGRGKQWNILEDGEREQEKIRSVQEENMRRAQEEYMHAAQEETTHTTMEEEMRRIEDLSKAATDSLELAVLKRNRAQTLMENADLAAYWATMAVKIAEAAQSSESTEIAASFYLD